jgi:ABC-type nitrate/sulfonate/bicarbonate transport system permease component
MTTTEAPGKGRPIQWEDIRLPPWVTGAIGVVGLVLVWWIISVIWINPSGKSVIPSPADVVVAAVNAGWEYFWRNFSVTLAEAGIGYVWGNVIALLLAFLVLIVPRMEGIVTQIAILTYCVPIVAIGMIAIILFPVPDPGQPSGTAVLLAALSVLFTTIVGALVGLKSADQTSLDLIRVYGGSKLTQLRKVRLIAALPAILNALQIAVPAAFLGAVLSEFFGKVEAGVGMSMMLAMQTAQSGLVWALAIASGIVALAGFAIVGFIARLITPWSKGASA